MRHTDEDCLDALRRAAADLDVGKLLMRQYRVWRSEQFGCPSEGLISWRFGSWADALKAAGLSSHHSPFGERRQVSAAPKPSIGPSPYRRSMGPCPSCGGELERQIGTRVVADQAIERGWCPACQEMASQVVT